MSRRSRGLSIGINLNPDTACNFDCVYCQVDRSGTPRVREVDLDRVRIELADMIRLAKSGALFSEPEFANVPAVLRRINDIAFSGDGEPTTCRHFGACVDLVAELKLAHDLAHTKIILITDACYLTRPAVAEALAVMDENDGEIWAKLDAGTEEYFRRVNRPNVSLQHVVDNITSAARVRPVVIQALFMRLGGVGPDEAEVAAFTERLNDIIVGGGSISYVQVYTVARPPAEQDVTALTNEEVDAIAERVRAQTGLAAECYYGS